jgi:hypothetical protein
MADMWQRPAVDRPSSDVLALQAHVERAGYALACPYSSSDEFEAAVIRAKLGPGAPGPRRRRRRLAIYVVVAIALAVAGLLF